MSRNKGVELGRRVRDTVTGFTGIGIEKRTYWNDNPLVLVCSEELESGRQVIESFDEVRLEYDDSEKKVVGFKEEKK